MAKNQSVQLKHCTAHYFAYPLWCEGGGGVGGGGVNVKDHLIFLKFLLKFDSKIPGHCWDLYKLLCAKTISQGLTKNCIMKPAGNGKDGGASKARNILRLAAVGSSVILQEKIMSQFF